MEEKSKALNLNSAPFMPISSIPRGYPNPGRGYVRP